MSFLVLIFAHLLADYPLQGEFLATMKGKNFIILFSHAGIWTGCIATAGYLLGYDVGILDVVLLFFVHALFDYLKAKPVGRYKEWNALTTGLLVDQFAHVLQILLFMSMN